MDKVFQFEQIKFSKALADLTGAGQVYKATIDSKTYAVKLYKPFSKESRDISRVRLRSYNLSDADLEARFHPWRRETRVYERIDSCICGPERQFFPKYYGTTKLKRSLCPREWLRICPDADDVPAVILELIDETHTQKGLTNLQISEATAQEAHDLLKQNLDAEYVHIYIHCMEKLEVLHNAKIIHGDVKPDIFLNCASVVLDFSRSWSWEDDKPCLDSFLPRKGPRSFETRQLGERNWLLGLVKDETAKEFQGRVPSWQNCGQCRSTMNELLCQTAD